MQTNALLKEPLTPGTCEWCGKVCEMEDVACSLSCEAQLHRLEAIQGRAVLRGLKRWRRYRGARGTAGEGLLTEISALVDTFLRTDRERREAHQQPSGQRGREARPGPQGEDAHDARPDLCASHHAAGLAGSRHEDRGWVQRMKLLFDTFETGLHVGVFCAGVVIPVGLAVILLEISYQRWTRK